MFIFNVNMPSGTAFFLQPACGQRPPGRHKSPEKGRRGKRCPFGSKAARILLALIDKGHQTWHNLLLLIAPFNSGSAPVRNRRGRSV